MKFINPEQQSKFVKIWHDVHSKFGSPRALERKLVDSYHDRLPGESDLVTGYFEKRSNAKRWIEDQEDLDAMYNAFSVGEEITLWVSANDPPQKMGWKEA